MIMEDYKHTHAASQVRRERELQRLRRRDDMIGFAVMVAAAVLVVMVMRYASVIDKICAVAS